MRAAYLQELLNMLRISVIDAAVVPCDDRPDACYLFDGEPYLAVVDGLKAAEEYADCWRGVLQCEPNQPS